MCAARPHRVIVKDQYKLQLAFPKNTRAFPIGRTTARWAPRQVVPRAGRRLGMGAMEKKRLLPALIAAALTVLAMGTALAEDTASLRGVRIEPGKTELDCAKKTSEKTQGTRHGTSGETALGDKKRFPRGKGTQRNNGVPFSLNPGPRLPSLKKTRPRKKKNLNFFTFFHSRCRALRSGRRHRRAQPRAR